MPGYGAPAYGPPPEGSPPRAYTVWAYVAAVGGLLVSTILGLPCAIAAIKHARRVRPYWYSGNQPAALSESRKARTWALVATVADLLSVVLIVALISTSSASNFSNPAVVAASIKTELQKRISTPGSAYYLPGVMVTSVVCTPIRAHTDRCIDHFSIGPTLAQIAVISANGDSYVAHADTGGAGG